MLDVQGRDDVDSRRPGCPGRPRSASRSGCPGRWYGPARRSSATWGFRARMASTSISSTAMPWYSWRRRGTTSRPSSQLGDIGPAVRFEKPDDDVDAVALQPVAFLEHLVGLADAGASSRDRPSAARAGSGGSSGGRRRPYLPASTASVQEPGSASATLTRGSPRMPRVRPSVQARSARRTSVSARPRALATRGGLETGVLGADMGIEAAGRSRHGVGGDEASRRAARSPSGSRRRAGGPSRSASLDRGPEVAAAGGRGVVAVPRRRGARVEICRRR